VKSSAALHQSLLSVQVLLLLILGLGALQLYFRDWITLIALGLATLYLLLEVVNVVYIRRRAARDPTFLNRRVS